MGLGSVGRFIAHSLISIPNPPPITLIFPRPAALKGWNTSKRTIRLKSGDVIETRSGFDAELALPRPRLHGREVQPEDTSNPSDPFASTSSTVPEPDPPLEGESTDPIHTLILCTKCSTVTSALSAVRDRLTPDSVILFLQNGMGHIDEVNAQIFPDPATRPHYMVGINSHGLNRLAAEPFLAVHAGAGTISLGILPHERSQNPAPYAPTPSYSPNPSATAPLPPPPPSTSTEDTPQPAPQTFRFAPTSRYLLRTLLRTPSLCATSFSPPDLLQLQLEKLAVNSIINPLTALLDARNGSLLYNYALTRSMRLLLSETSLVLRSLPELAHIPGIATRFDPGRLETLVVRVASKTKDNVSSMLADVRAGRRTEVEYMNGWVVKRGEELGVRCTMNFLVKELVKGKQGMVQWELGEDVPFVGKGDGEV